MYDDYQYEKSLLEYGINQYFNSKAAQLAVTVECTYYTSVKG